MIHPLCLDLFQKEGNHASTSPNAQDKIQMCCKYDTCMPDVTLPKKTKKRSQKCQRHIAYRNSIYATVLTIFLFSKGQAAILKVYRT